MHFPVLLACSGVGGPMLLELVFLVDDGKNAKLMFEAGAKASFCVTALLMGRRWHLTNGDFEG